MTHLRRFIRRIATLLRSNKAEQELAREIQAHLQLLEDQFVAKGMSRGDARYAARRTFGGVEQAKEQQRDARSFRWLAGWPMDMKLGVRMLAKSPGLTVIAVVALAVAIGGGAAYLEFMQDLAKPTLPVPGGDRVVGIQIWQTDQQEPEPRALADFAAWRGSINAIEHFGAATALQRHLITGDGRIDGERGVEISASAFGLVPTTPLLGRGLADGDERAGAAPVAVLGHDLWQSRFGGDPNIIGRSVRIGADFHTIVGVMPATFGFPVNHNLWVPLQPTASGLKRGEGPAIRMFGRLREGVRAEAAAAELDAKVDGPQVTADVRPYVNALLSTNPEDRAQLLVLYAANLFFIMLLCICGANVATLVFARTATRESEITVRTALGASRGRISAQLFAEALVLSLVAAVAGLAGAAFGVRWIKRTVTEAQGAPAPFWWDDRLNLETLAYGLGLAVLAALIVGVVPALKATGARMQTRLREAGAGVSSMKFGRLWTGVIIGQIAVTMLFLVSAVSFGQAVYRGPMRYDVAFPREQVLTARLTLDARKAPEEKAAAYRELARRMAAMPGVKSVTYGDALPGYGGEFWLDFSTPDVAKDAQSDDDVLWARSAVVAPNYFESFDMPIVAGRSFSEAEALGAHKVTVVDETFVRLILGGRNPIGVLVREPVTDVRTTPGAWHEIIGVVKDATRQPDKRTRHAMLYMPGPVTVQSPIEVMVRTNGPAAPLTHALQAAALAADADMRLSDVATMDRLADGDALAMSFFLKAFAIIAAVALLLSTAGIHALIAFTLSRRTREIGIRMALGAEPRRIITAVFARSFKQIGFGLAAGSLPAAAILSFGLGEVSDGSGLPIGLALTAGVAAFILLVAGLACIAPLRRALAIEPTEALRNT